MGKVVNIQCCSSLCFGCIFLLMLQLHFLSKFISPLENNFSEKQTLILLCKLGSFQKEVIVLGAFNVCYRRSNNTNIILT